MSVMTRRLLLAVLPLALLTATARQGLACSTPVFRYALERWAPEPYELIIFHKGGLAPADQEGVEWLRKTAAANEARPNVDLRLVDLAEPLDEATQAVWNEFVVRPSGRSSDSGDGLKPALRTPSREGAVELPWMVIRYPRFLEIPHHAWAGRLSPEAAKAAVDSPARRDIVKRILGGASAVWVLLGSGKPESDDAAARVLQDALKKMEKELVLPEPMDAGFYGDPPPTTEDEEGAAETKLTVSFPLVRLARKAPGEEVFIGMLLAVEPDLATCGKPITFPIFGQGRALFALVGDGITGDNIADACAFLTGPCACQVKAMNPGVDLLMLADWEGGLMGQPMAAEPLLPLPGTLAPSAKTVDSGQWTEGSRQSAEGSRQTKAEEGGSSGAQSAIRNPRSAIAPTPSNTLWRNTLIAVGAGVALLAVVAFVMMRKPGG